MEYRVVGKLGEGGMATVYRAFHVRFGAPAALKVLKPGPDGTPVDVALLEAEIRANARMRHPNIVNVLDVGVLDADIRVDDEILRKGQSFYVMELVEGSSLDRHPPLRWLALKELLLHVLDALAHAHAHGVIHRDLKPSNILLARTARGELPKIADFGIAKLDVEQVQGDAGAFAGTPAYMAPEQIKGQGRELGPWTDLYALGCMAYELVTGEPPFLDRDYMQILRMHLTAPVPPLPAAVRVPPGFESWIARLLTKDPRGRFHHAADAAMGLLGLPPMPGNPFPRPGVDPNTREVETLVAATTTIFDATLLMTPVHAPAAAATEGRVVPMRTIAPPVPQTWEPPQMPTEGVWRTTGISLFGVRPPPFVGRRHEKRHLWTTLRTVYETGRPACAVITGPPGVGKTRLAEWLAERADELGVATPLRATHDPADTSLYGLGGLFARYFRIAGLSRSVASARVQEWFRLAGLEAFVDPALRLVELMTRAPDEQSLERFQGGESVELLYRLTRVATIERPVVVFLDDVAGAGESLRYAARILETGERPILLVATAPSIDASEELKELVERNSPAVLDLDELPAREMVAFFESYLGVEAHDARYLAEYADGNPGVAVELVKNAINRGALVETNRGYMIQRGAGVMLPAPVRDALRARVRAFVDGWRESARPAARRAIEIAATLGFDFDANEGCRALTYAGIALPDGYLARAEEARLLVRDGARWTFANRMLRDDLLRESEEAGNLPQLHDACLAALQGEEGPDIAARRAVHLQGAGRDAEALEPLIEAAEHPATTPSVADELINRFMSSPAAAELPPNSLLIGRGLAAFALTHLRGAHGKTASFAAAEAYRIGELNGDDRLMARSALIHALWAYFYGTREEGLARALEVLEHAPRIADRAVRADVLSRVAIPLAAFGEPQRALEFTRDALELARELPPDARARLMLRAVDAAAIAGELDCAVAWLAELRAAPDVAKRQQFVDAVAANLAATRGDVDETLRLVDRSTATGVLAPWMEIRADLYRQLSYARRDHWRVDPGLLQTIAASYHPRSFEHALCRLVQCVHALRKGDPDSAANRLAEADVAFSSGKVSALLASYADWAAQTAKELGFDDCASHLAIRADQQWRALRTLS